jgi:plasmid stabilization system protein ParE
MAYAVNLTARAERDLVWLYRVVNVEASLSALKWYTKLKQAILSLEENPNRCPFAPENEKYRHLLYGRKPHIYRVIYRVRETQKQVDVLHIRHGARRPFEDADARADDVAEKASRGEDVSGYFTNMFVVVVPEDRPMRSKLETVPVAITEGIARLVVNVATGYGSRQ